MRFRLVAACALVWAAAAWAQGNPTHLMRYADVHGDRIVFTYEGDLWLVSARGGDARRITNDPGNEGLAKFSPDGSLIAFTGSYDGGVDVYVMAAGGGVPRRLTYHPAPDYVLGWTRDGKDVLFRTRREYPYREEQIYTVPVAGGMVTRLPVDQAGLTSFSPDGQSIAYNRISNEGATWKRHQGGDAQDVWMGSLAKGDFHKITSWPGIDNYPMWWGDGIYFTSDREAGTLNIFRYDVKTGQTRAVTHYTDYDVKYPSLGDGQIVYQYGESLYLLDLKTEQSRKVDVTLPSDRVPVRTDLVEASADTGAFGLSPDGKWLLLESRGEVLEVPADKEDGPFRNLTRASGSREKECAWSPDGKQVAFLSDKTGEDELYLVGADGGRWKQLTSGGKGYRFHVVWSPDSRHLLYGDKFMRLNLVDAATGAVTVIDKGDYDDGWERWGIQDFVFSPDSRWVAYTKKTANTNEVILLYSLDTGKIAPVTDDTSESWSPSFDPSGRYLYFLSNRSYTPVMGVIDQDHLFLDMTLPYVVVLKDGAPSPFSPQAEGASEKPAPAKEAKGGKAPAAPVTAIDLAGLDRRTVPVPGVEAGKYFRLEATEKGFLYLAAAELEFPQTYAVATDTTTLKCDLMAYDLKAKKADATIQGINAYHLSADGKKLVYRAGKAFGVVDAGAKAKTGDGAVDLADVRFPIERLPEFRQMFNEAWRIERDWYYDPNMQGNDWQAIHDKYGRFVDDCGNRSDLNYLIGEMIAELNSGHTYVYGGDTGNGAKRVGVGLLGCDFDTPAGAAFHRIRHVVPGRTWDAALRSPLEEPGCPIREGDYLIAVDGEKIPASENVYAHLVDRAGRLVTLTYNTKPSEEGARTWRVKTLKSEAAIRYQEWVDARAAYVEKASNGRIGYIHLPDMMEDGLIQFAKGFYPQSEKEAILIDARYNGGGFTSSMIIDRMERKVWSATQPREGKPTLNPEAAYPGPYAVVINEDTGSDGEMFSEAIKIKHLAKLFGMRTWGGANGIEAHENLVDGGNVTPPQFGLYGLDGKWLIEGHGVDPDVVVQNMPGDVLKGKDAQLDAAVAYLLDQTARHPFQIPPHPPYPDKAKPHGSDMSLPQ